MSLAMVGIAIPNFVMAPLLTLVFGVYLGWLPAGGWGGGALPLPDPAGGVAGPAAGGAHRAAGARRHDRGAAAPTTSAPRGPRACASGWSLLRHALRGALLPVVSYLGP